MNDEMQVLGTGTLSPNRRKDAIQSVASPGDPKYMAIMNQPDYMGHLCLPQAALPYDLKFTTPEGVEVVVPVGSVLGSYAALELGGYIHQQSYFALRVRRWWTKEKPKRHG